MYSLYIDKYTYVWLLESKLILIKMIKKHFNRTILSFGILFVLYLIRIDKTLLSFQYLYTRSLSLPERGGLFCRW